MAEWINPTYKDVGLEPVIEKAGEGIDAVVSLLNTVPPILDGLSSIIQPLEILLSPSIWTSLSGAAIQELESFLDNLAATDGYMFVMLPLEWSDVLRPYSFVEAFSALSESLADRRDPNRPIADDSAAWAALTILGSSSNWEDFQRIIDLFSRFFNGDEASKWKRLLDYQFNVDHKEPLPREARPSQGTPRDWQRAGFWELLPGVAEGLETARNALSDFKANYGQIAAGLEKLADLIRERLAYYEEVVATLDSLVRALQDWRSLVPSLHILFDGGTSGGTGAYLDSFTRSPGAPAGLLVGGFTFLAIGANAANNVRNIANVLGLELARAGVA